MTKIKIRHFGPIKEGYHESGGWIDVKKVTLIIGNQGSGKSTIAKLISTFTWIEKALTRGDYDSKWFSKKSRLKNQFLNYHRLENYLNVSGKTEIEYEGEAYNIKFENESLKITEIKNSSYPLPQIMYVPAERNFIAYVKSPKELKLSSDSLKEFLTEFDNAKDDIKGVVNLPINNVAIDYDRLNDIINLRGADYKVRLTEASSGFQSLVPLYLVSNYLANSVKRYSDSKQDNMSSEELDRFKNGVEEIWANEYLSTEQRRAALSVLSSKFNKTAFINIVEEPEQNLFPESQWQMLKSLLRFNNLNESNKFIATTHSPYIVSYLNLAIKGYLVSEKIKFSNHAELITRLTDIVPLESVVDPDSLIVYELDNEGNISRLEDYKGLLSDENYLNESLAEINQSFADLLEIEQVCQ